MKIAIQGLGRMGMQMVRKLTEAGDFEVIGYDVNPEAVTEAAGHGATAASTKEEVVQAFGNDRPVVWIMVPDKIVPGQVDEWLALLPKESIIIDGGNSNYTSTQAVNQTVTNAGMHYMDVGTSGGVWGYENGFCMMVGGGTPETYAILKPVLEAFEQPKAAHQYFGESGSGHFVKMVHNAIEYGMMQALAEGYQVIKEGPYKGIDLAAVGEVWEHESVIRSWLNELSRDVLRENPELEGISGYVAASGEAHFTLEAAQKYGVKMPVTQASVDVRTASQNGEVSFATKLVAAQRNKFGGHNLNGEGAQPKQEQGVVAPAEPVAEGK